jgi:diguanylate cyclase (GGDEF)-like protein
MQHSAHHAARKSFIRHADWWPPLLAVLLLVLFWATLIERARHDDLLVMRAAFVNHGNVAQAMANHTGQLVERLRFYSQSLARRSHAESSRALVRAALGQDPAFLRLMYFDAAGRLEFSSGARPEPWLLKAARNFAALPAPGAEEQIAVGTVPTEAFAQAWHLPVFHRPPLAEPGRTGFLLALVDLGHFARSFEGTRLGKSGEIVLVNADGRELLRMNAGRLDAVYSIADSKRLQLAFAQETEALTEPGGDGDERLYAARHLPQSPFAVLVSRTREDVLSDNQATQRGYWLSALALTALMLSLSMLWLGAARRRHSLIVSLTQAYEDNARLIEQIGKEKEAAYRLATHDKLTGLANRMLFADLAERFVARARRMRGNFAVMFIDLDRFKPINDTHGHKAGDLLLIEVAQRLRECVRQSDVVARFGGDEFVALAGELHGSQDAAAIADKIVERLSQPFTGIVATDLHVTPSIGIALYPDDATEIEALLRQADAAMYQAKEQGRATFVFADPALNRRNDFNNRIEAALPLALRQGEIEVHYQPKVSLKDFGITGLEALARWHHAELGTVSPADFIPVAEKSGAIVELGEYVIAAVCRQLETWWRDGVPLVPVAVNVSPRQLRSPHLYDFIAGTLERHGIAPRYLEIEITETGLVDASEGFIATLRRLDGLGIRLAIDDFGTGFSGLSHLRALPAKYLKIDRSFIKDIRNDINDATIVSSTISLAHNLHLQAIAEGVETSEQVVHLRAARCDQAQGFFFSRPCDAEATTALLAQKFIYGNMDEES